MIRVLPSLAVACFIFFANCLLAQNDPPVITCPGNILINLAPGACESVVNFNVTATDDNITPAINQLGPPWLTSGDLFPIGVTTLTYQAVDDILQTDECSFDITIVEYSPASPGLVCDPDLHISIPGTCEMFLQPAQVLEGNYGCYDDFSVDVENTGSNYIGPSYVGQTIGYTVTNNDTGMDCWGEVTIEDYSGPLISGCNDTTLLCLSDTRPVSEGGEVVDPTFQDCYSFTFDYVDMAVQGDCTDPYSAIIMRTWTAVDELGNTSECMQTITVERVSLMSITPICPTDTLVECEVGVTPDFSPEAMGYPTAIIGMDTFQIAEGTVAACNVTSTYTDEIIDACGVGYKIIRHWSVYDWCLPLAPGSNPWTCTQLITYMDTTPPTVAGPADMTASGNLPGCRARPTIPASTVTDCSATTVFISTPVGTISGNGGQIPAPGLTLGTHTISVKVTDECGNSTTETFTIEVLDMTAPSPVCDAFTVVTLDDTGYAFANAISFDDGSTDNCCVDGFEVRRMTDNCGIADNLVFGDFIEFCCEDVGEAIPVELRVFDCNGNSNTCQVEATVQDIAGPSITCPPNVNLFCGDDFNSPAVVGEVVTDPTAQGPNDGLALDNCGGDLTVTSNDVGGVTCGSGTIFRTWAATDASAQTAFCVQTITVTNNNPFTGGNIQFPADITVFGCDAATDPDSTGVPSIPQSTSCNDLVIGMGPDMILDPGSVCQKILRTWYVYDWCQYDPNVPNSPGVWTNTQTISVMDQGAPSFPVCENRTFCNFHNDCNDLAPDLSVAATDLCTDDADIFYTWTVDLFDDSLPDPAGYVTSGAGQNTTNPYPIGTHLITYTAFDGCGNNGACSFLFTIADCKTPTIFCNNINVEIMQTGMVPVGIDLVEEGSSFDNCSDRAALQFSFSPDVNDVETIFTCAEIGMNVVQVWATDEAGNQDFCEAIVTVQDNMNACGGGPLVAGLNGTIETEGDDGVEDVTIELNGNMSNMTYTNGTGAFQFANLPIGFDYSITPVLNEDPLNGVTTYDIYLLHRHTLGVQILDSPYKLIAGDVNNNGSLTIGDVLDIRKLILAIEDEFPSNSSWRFVEANYAFPDPQDPFNPAYPEVCNINNFASTTPAQDFIGVKIGDVNGSVSANLLGSTEDRNSGLEMILQTTDQEVKKGETVTIDFTADMVGLVGYQFTLNFDPAKVSIEDLLPGKDATESNFGLTRINEGALTASWHQLVAARTASDEALFSLTFKALENGKVSDWFHLNSRLTKAAGYEEDGSERSIVLDFNTTSSSVSANRFELFQNVPNPFNGSTTIGFQLPETTTATLTVFDVSGRVIKTVKADFAEGYHEVKMDKEEFGQAGVFYYRLETAEHTATMKMTLF